VRTIDPTTPVGDVVVSHPAAAGLFEELGVDYCCGGRRTLAEACERRGLDAATVAALLDARGRRTTAAGPETHDVSRASIAELCEHISVRHHGPLGAELTRIGKLVDTVVRVHGDGHPELGDLQRVFGSMRAELEAHVRVEEARLFPACRAAEDAAGDRAAAGFDDELLALLEDEHDATGQALVAIRELCGGYDPALGLCGTHRRLLESLRGFEAELHQHVHEENNILFPRMRELLAPAA
jgi:regulator of cell morphogenesis and NO signaling